MHAELKENLIEPIPIHDTYVDGLHSVDRLKGGNYRFNFYVEHISPIDGTRERHVVSRLVAPRMSVVQAIILVARSIGFQLAGEVSNDP